MTEAHGADAGTRDAQGSRYGGERLGQHAGPLVWLTVFLMCAGFSLAGVAIIFQSLLWFIVGAAIFVVSGIASLAAGIMNTTE
ncbi:MAG: hypothetical protein ACJ735_15640 [Actinomycetes bacterium]